jgi:hypothetical protein
MSCLTLPPLRLVHQIDRILEFALDPYWQMRRQMRVNQMIQIQRKAFEQAASEDESLSIRMDISKRPMMVEESSNVQEYKSFATQPWALGVQSTQPCCLQSLLISAYYTAVFPNEGQVMRNASFPRYPSRSKKNKYNCCRLPRELQTKTFFVLKSCLAHLIWPSLANTTVCTNFQYLVMPFSIGRADASTKVR